MTLPKWAQNAVTVRHRLDPNGSIEDLESELRRYPQEAAIEAWAESDYYNQHYFPVFEVSWQRDYTTAEYEKEKAARAKRRQEAKERKANEI